MEPAQTTGLGLDGTGSSRSRIGAMRIGSL
jgi:hypothetical protein